MIAGSGRPINNPSTCHPRRQRAKFQHHLHKWKTWGNLYVAVANEPSENFTRFGRQKAKISGKILENRWTVASTSDTCDSLDSFRGPQRVRRPILHTWSRNQPLFRSESPHPPGTWHTLRPDSGTIPGLKRRRRRVETHHLRGW